MSYLAPAGTPLSPWLYAAALGRSLRPANAMRRLQSGLESSSGHRHSWLYSTGRAAMVVALRAMREAGNAPQRTEVIIAGYTCYSVPASVLLAGLRPRLCDMQPDTLNFDLEQLQSFDFSKVLAIVTANLCGLPNALTQIETIAKHAGVRLLDDAAQALGASHERRPAGGFGDIGLFSFDKGKNITSLEGGALVASDPALAQALDNIHQTLAPTPAVHTGITLTKLAAYSLLLRPSLYGVVHRLPFLGLGKTRYEDSYPLLRYPPALAGFSGQLHERLAIIQQARAANAAALRTALQSSTVVEPVELLPSAVPSYTRLPVLARNPQQRQQLISALDRAGIGATGLYPCALPEVPEVRPHLHQDDLHLPGAQAIAERLITLPVHPYCPPGYAQRIAAIIGANS